MKKVTQNKTVLSLEGVRLPLKDVRVIIQDRVCATRRNLCDDFSVILRRISSSLDNLIQDIYTADNQGETVSFAQLHNHLNYLRKHIVSGEEFLEKQRVL